MVKCIYNYLVSPDGDRTTSKKNINGSELLLNTELQNHNYVTRIGTIISTPIVEGLALEINDDVILHHNVFRRFRDVRGKEKNSKNYYKEDVYFVQPDQIYAYKRDTEWEAIDGFCFIKPIKETKMFSDSFERPLVGIVKYGNGDIKKGSLIGFKPGTEYEFIIEGQRLYRVPTNLITIEYEYQGDEEEYNPRWT
jgi:hypothetical protein